MKELDFRAFNFITSDNGRIGSLDGRTILDAYGIPMGSQLFIQIIFYQIPLMNY